MTLINYEDLQKIRENHKDEKIVFCSGSFDLTHAGHVLFFEDCKKLGDILLIGIGGDEIIKKNKGIDRPITNIHARLKVIDSLRITDYCLIDDDSLQEHKYSFVEFVLKNLKPDVYVINEDAEDIPVRKELLSKTNTELKILKRWCPEGFEEISTSKIIKKIKEL
tara:strand:- start:7647 stop:8141 length:495 start_codon:yes stop_codon:yes gene_type:complete